MQSLTSKQKKHLKSQAHHLNPLAQIGKSGLSPQVLESINTLLEQHELIKIKFNDFKDEKHEIAQNIVETTHSSFVSIIGHVLTLYRENEDPQKRRYHLP